jgi:hypothetical protein
MEKEVVTNFGKYSFKNQVIFPTTNIYSIFNSLWLPESLDEEEDIRKEKRRKEKKQKPNLVDVVQDDSRIGMYFKFVCMHCYSSRFCTMHLLIAITY